MTPRSSSPSKPPATPIALKEEDPAVDSSSPTPTLRNVSSTIRPSVTSVMNAGEAGPSSYAAAVVGDSKPGESSNSSTTARGQGEIGRGLPGREGRPKERGPSNLAPPSPSTTFHRATSPSGFSEYSTDEDYSFAADPRIPKARFGMSSINGRGPSGSEYGSPSMTTTPQSPHTAHPGGSIRPARLPRNNSTSGHPVSYPVNPNASSHPAYATASRSTSRARPAVISSQSGQIITLGKGKTEDAELEEEFMDRGEDLIRRRQRERKQARRKKEKAKEKKQPGDTSLPPSASLEGSLQDQQKRSLGTSTLRSTSRPRIPSGTSTYRRKEPSDYFTSYAESMDGSETPRDETLSPRAALRAASIYSSTADEDEDDQRELVAEVVNDIVAEEVPVEEHEEEEEEEVDGGEGDGESEEGVTLRDRQDAINIEHPFGLPIWKPALYRKSRSITRNAESALHSIPSAAAERHLLPGNIAWVVLFGWWLTLICLFSATIMTLVEMLTGITNGYGKTLRGLAWYIGWPFGKYVEGDGFSEEEEENDQDEYGTFDSPSISRRREPSDGSASNLTVRQQHSRSHDLTEGLPDEPRVRKEPTVTFAPSERSDEESAPLLPSKKKKRNDKKTKIIGRLVYWPLFWLIIAPLMLCVCTFCWGFVITIPMAKLSWALIKLLYFRPLEINFRSAPKVAIPFHSNVTTGQTESSSSSPDRNEENGNSGNESGSTTLNDSPSGIFYRRAHLKAGQVAPTSGPKSTVLLCVYRAVGLEYYKYTVGGVNILFINLLPIVFFTIIDGLFILPYVERQQHHGKHISQFLLGISTPAFVFILSLASVIPLSYFIGMAVASISAQSSIGMGAVINATFGSVIEIILYSIALTQGKGRLVEGSIVGSILAGVLLMPGASMCSGALKRKEQKFNAKSAGVTSTMLIMAIIGTLTPTMFYQTYGSFELICDGCPPIDGTGDAAGLSVQDTWKCQRCHYEHPDPQNDPFYQDQVKVMMYCCAGILLFSYLIGLWFSLRTHASQIWQNPQRLLKPEDAVAAVHPAVKATLAQRMTPQAVMQHVLPLHKDRNLPVTPTQQTNQRDFFESPHSAMKPPLLSEVSKLPKVDEIAEGSSSQSETPPPPPPPDSRSLSAKYDLPIGYTPFLQESFQGKNEVAPMKLPGNLTTEDFTRAVAVATVSALRHQGSIIGTGSHSSGGKPRLSLNLKRNENENQKKNGGDDEEDEEEHGGHEAPSWTRGVSAGVLLGCTLLYAAIAEILVDVVDVVLQGLKIDEKFLGLTLFALVPNTTEFMNAMSFAMNGNIALSMEIGSAYALQVCLLQIPAMVAFSAFYDPGKMGEVVDTFTLIFPRWDVIAIILSIFLLTYTYIEARSNYHRGSILVLAYIVLMMGFYYAPVRTGTDGDTTLVSPDSIKEVGGFMVRLTKLWA